MANSFEIYLDDDKYYFQLIHEKDGVIFKSQGYSNAALVEEEIHLIKKHVENIYNFEVKITHDGRYYFEMKASKDKHILGHSLTYSSMIEAKRGIKLVSETVPGAVVVKLEEEVAV